MPAPFDFDTVIAPLTRAQFFAQYDGKAYVHLRGSKGRFAHIFTWDDLNAALEQQRLSPPLLKVMQDGRQVDPERYQSAGWGNVPRLDAGRLIACLAAGASLVLDCAEELSPNIRAVSNAFRDVFHARNYVNLYAGWHSQKALDLHWDSQNITILQLSGRKRWQVYAPTRLHPLQGDIEKPPRPTGAPVWDGILEDGDVLYMPRGWWHVAHPVDEPSLHMTIGSVPPHGHDLLNWMTAKLRSHIAVRQDLPAPGDHAAREALAKDLRGLMEAVLTPEAIAQFQNEWHAEIRPQPHINLPHAPYQQNLAVTDATHIRLASSHRLAFTAHGAGVEFKANGILYGVPTALMPALELLRDDAALPVTQLAAKIPPAAHADLKRSLAVLAKAGILLLETDKDTK